MRKNEATAQSFFPVRGVRGGGRARPCARMGIVGWFQGAGAANAGTGTRPPTKEKSTPVENYAVRIVRFTES